MWNVQDSRFPGDCCVLFWDGGLSITADMLPPSLSRWPQKNWLNKYLDNISCCRLPGVGKLISLTDGHSLNFGYIYLAHKQIMLSCDLVVIWSGASWKQKQIYKILTPPCPDIVCYDAHCKTRCKLAPCWGDGRDARRRWWWTRGHWSLPLVPRCTMVKYGGGWDDWREDSGHQQLDAAPGTMEISAARTRSHSEATAQFLASNPSHARCHLL